MIFSRWGGGGGLDPLSPPLDPRMVVCYGLNSTTVLDYSPDIYDTSYLNMQHLGTGHSSFCVLTEFFVRFQQSCAIEASLRVFWNSIGSLSQTVY